MILKSVWILKYVLLLFVLYCISLWEHNEGVFYFHSDGKYSVPHMIQAGLPLISCLLYSSLTKDISLPGSMWSTRRPPGAHVYSEHTLFPVFSSHFYTPVRRFPLAGQRWDQLASVWLSAATQTPQISLPLSTSPYLYLSLSLPVSTSLCLYLPLPLSVPTSLFLYLSLSLPHST